MMMMERVLFIWRRGRMMVRWSFFVKWRFSWIINRSGIVVTVIRWWSRILVIRRWGRILMINGIFWFMIRQRL